jgi:hypothetical protein
MSRNQPYRRQHHRASGLELDPHNPLWLAAILEDALTWRQLRGLAKTKGMRQYSYLGKRGLSLALACLSINQTKRLIKSNAIHYQRSTSV